MKPRIQIVDDNDQIIALTERSAIDYKAGTYRVAALWLTNSTGEVLLTQRKLTKDKDPGKWGPAVVGTVEEGETYESNIIKEAEEEIGLTGVNFEIGPKDRITEPQNFFCQWFMAQIDQPASDFVIQEEEVERVAWVAIDELTMDIKVNPDEYISSMPRAIELLT